MSDLTDLSIAEAAERIRRRALSPVELTEAYLDRIRRLDSTYGAYITLLEAEARAAAAAAEREIAAGSYRGPLHGIPVAVKDLIQTRGIRTTAGSTILREWVPTEDATVVRRLAQAGAILLGKLNLHEFAYGPTGVNPHYGTPRNPWDRSRMPGGSSSGSGVAVAARLAAAALGTDTGGSIRIPSSLCGIVGIKASYGRVSRAGVLPLAWSLDHIGPMARTVADAALLLGALAGKDPADPSTVALPVPDYREALRGEVRGVRLGLPRELFFQHLDPAVEAAVRGAARLLEGQGATVAEVSLPAMSEASAASYAIIATESMAYHAPLLRRHAPAYGADVRTRLLAGQYVLGTQYVNAQRVRQVIRAELEAALRKFDALLLPTTPLPAPRIEEREAAVDGISQDVRAWLTRCTRPFNLTGSPALSLPCGLTPAGLPVGLQLVGRMFDEATLFRVGAAFEAVSPMRGRRPPEA